MTPKISFEFAVLHYRHDLITHEFLNVGLVLFSKENLYFKSRLLTKYKRLVSMFPGADGEFYKKYIDHLQLVLDEIGNEISSKQYSFLASEQNKLKDILQKALPYDDSSIFFGESNYGNASDIDKVFEEIYSRQVEYYLPKIDRETRSDEEIWTLFRDNLIHESVLSYLSPHTVITPHDEIKFEHGWQNKHWNLLQPVSFDLAIATNIKKKAREWLGTTVLLDSNKDISNLFLLLGKPRLDKSDLRKAYAETKDILNTKTNNYKINLIEEDEASDFAKHIKPIILRDIESHQ